MPDDKKPTIVEELLDLEIPCDVQISPDSQHIVYATSLHMRQKKGEHRVSKIWVAKTGHEKSAQQTTSGQFKDQIPKWSPDSQTIAFTSDRGKAGESDAIYLMSMKGFGGEPYAITPAENEQDIEDFFFSPDGKFIAYISPDEKTPEKKQKEKDKDDPQVWNEDLEFTRLRIIHLATKKITTLVSRDRQITHFAWSADGTKIAFADTKTTEIVSDDLYGHELNIVDIASKEIRKIAHMPNILQDFNWVGDKLFFRSAYDLDYHCTSHCIYSLEVNVEDPKPHKLAYGEDNCADGFIKAGDDLVACVADGLEFHLEMLNGRKLRTLKQNIHSWDAKFTSDSDEMILAVATSSTGKPTEVYSATASGGALVQLSSHGESLGSDYNFGTFTPLSCQSSDDKHRIDAVFVSPTKGQSGDVKKPFPTIVIPHGGPYGHCVDSFDPEGFYWGPALVNAGYAVMYPNYRGSSGRGNKFASYVRGGLGTADYDDVITLTQHAVEEGLADKDRLMIGGWSQGGFLSYISTVRNGLHGHGWKFKAAIPGAGVSDADTMTFTSDMGASFELELGGLAPWRADKTDVTARKGSTIWEFKKAMDHGDVIPPMLILHGEKDERVPLEQAVMIRRALHDYKLPFEYVVYPREPHCVSERQHSRDMLERVLRWADTYIG